MDDIKADLLLKAIQQSHQPIAILSRGGKIAWTNDGFDALTGYESEEIAGLPLTDIFNDSEYIQFPFEEENVFKELYMSQKDGPDLCLEVHFSPMADNQNETTHFILEVTEIKQKNESPEKFKEQLEQYRQIISSLNEGYILVDEQGNIYDVNPAYCDMVGYTRDELLSMKIEDLRKEMTGEYRLNFIQSVREEGGKKFRTQHHRKDGSIVDLEATVSIIEKNDTTYLAGFVWDISDRLQAEQQLEESEERWQQLVNNNSLPIIISRNGVIKFVNRAALDLYGAEDKEQILGKSILSFIPDESKDEVEGLISKVSRGAIIESSEQSFITLDGELKDVEIHTVPIVYQGENAAQTVFKDISEIKQKQRELKVTQQRFMSLFKHNPHPVYYFNLEGNFLGANKKVEEVSEYPESELLSMNFAPIIVEEDLERTLKHFEAATRGEVREYEIKIKTKTGTIKDLRVNNFPMKVFDEIVGVFGIAEDITESKKAKEDLKKSEQKWQHLVEDNPQPVQVTIDGEIVFINEAGAKLYGAEKPEEIIGRSIFEFSHPDFLEMARYRKGRIEKGLPVEDVYEHKITLLDGETRFVEINSIPINFQGEEAIQTVLYDVTDRKKKESIIEASLVEKEVLLKEIHHRVKNNMAVISGLLELQSMSTDDSSLQELLKESQLRIYSMAMIHEKLYQTETFSDIEFGDYVKQLVQTITDTIDVSNKEIEVSYDLGPARLNINQAIPAALILNEAVVNSFKHAFSDLDKGQIDISVVQDESRTKLRVEDNGVGLPDEFELDKQQSLGITLIQTLSRQLNGDVLIANSSDGNGTCVELSFGNDN